MAAGNSTAGFGRDFHPWESKEAKKGNRGNHVKRAGSNAKSDEERKATMAKEDAAIAAEKAAHQNRLQKGTTLHSRGRSSKRDRKQGSGNPEVTSNIPANHLNQAHSALQTQGYGNPFGVYPAPEHQPLGSSDVPAYGSPALDHQNSGSSRASLMQDENERSSKRHKAHGTRHPGYPPTFAGTPHQYGSASSFAPRVLQQPGDVPGYDQLSNEVHGDSNVISSNK